MKILFLGDIVGRPGREIIKENLLKIRNLENIDYVIANYENAAHGFGVTIKTANELFSLGIDAMTGGNHTWDKKEISSLFETHNVIRPVNLPEGADGEGVLIDEVNGEKIAVVNLMGYYTMPMVDNPFTIMESIVDELERQEIKHIFIDIHGEATSEKNALLQMFKGRVSAICGTHTHVGTDDLQIYGGTGYVTEAGLNGCFDGVIGMGSKEPIYRFKTGMKASYEVPKKCLKIFQGIVFDLDSSGKCIDSYKVKAYDNVQPFISQKAFHH
ncbi:MAG: YmdB family metallophosphoesterase [Campylobacterales bacterium]|nr:YmdB family metallophosphoesterase [Campylobacterales bacterium]